MGDTRRRRGQYPAGGGGGNETAVIAAVTVSRGLVFWTPVVVGSLTLAGIQVRERLTAGG